MTGLVRSRVRAALQSLNDWSYEHEVFRPSILFVLVLASAIGIALLIQITGERRAEPTARPTAQPTLEPGIQLNPAGGYRFRAPAGWKVSTHGSDSTVQSPTGRTVVTLSVGRNGSLRASSDRLVSSVVDAQEHARIIGEDQRDLGGLPAIQVSGIGTNPAGRKVRFLAIAIREGPENYLITIFVPAGSSGETLFPPIARIIRSLEPVEPSV